jgi:glycosyltransferase involved in cell wall biosynthesis
MSNPRKKILFITTAMSGGGAERCVVEIINNLDRLRYAPELALFRKEGPYLSAISDDIPIHKLAGCNTGYKSTLRTRKIIRELIDATAPDVIMSHLFPVNLSLLRSIILHKKRIPPVIVTEHNNLTRNLNKKHPVKKTLNSLEMKLTYQFADKIVCVSKGIRDNLVEYGLDENKINVINNPIDIEHIIKTFKSTESQSLTKKQQEVKQIVAAGRLIDQKAYSDLIHAFSLVQKSVQSKLTILGEGELRPVLEKQIKDLNLDEFVEMPGFVNNPWSIIHDADLYVLSSHWEGFGNVIIEAMACGTPIVSTDCDYGPREIITKKEDGILVPVGDIKALSRAMLSVLTDKKLTERLIKNGKEKVKKFDKKVIIKRYEQLFEDVMCEKEKNR